MEATSYNVSDNFDMLYAAMLLVLSAVWILIIESDDTVFKLDLSEYLKEDTITNLVYEKYVKS